MHELLREQRLVLREALDNGASLLVGVQVLVGGEQPLPVHQIDVVLVVEAVGSPDVENGGGVGGRRGTDLLEVVGEGFLHGGVLGGVETAGEGGAVAEADSVAAGEGDEVGGVQVLGGQEFYEGAGVGGRRREVGYGCVC